MVYHLADGHLIFLAGDEMAGNVLKRIDKPSFSAGATALPASGVFLEQKRGAAEETAVEIGDEPLGFGLLEEADGGVVSGVAPARGPFDAGNGVASTQFLDYSFSRDRRRCQVAEGHFIVSAAAGQRCRVSSGFVASARRNFTTSSAAAVTTIDVIAVPTMICIHFRRVQS